MTSVHKKYELGKSQTLTSPILSFLTRHFDDDPSDLLPVKHNKYRKTLRIYNSKNPSIPTNDGKETLKASAPYSDTYLKGRQKSITSQSFFEKNKETSGEPAKTEANNSSKTIDKERENREEEKAFCRGIHVSRSGRFREKARIRNRVFSMDGYSLVNVDNNIVEKQNKEHLSMKNKQVNLSQQFSFLNEQDSNRGPSGLFTVAQCQDFEKL